MYKFPKLTRLILWFPTVWQVENKAGCSTVKNGPGCVINKKRQRGDKEGDKISHSDQILRLTGNGNIDSGGRDLKNVTICVCLGLIKYDIVHVPPDWQRGLDRWTIHQDSICGSGKAASSVFHRSSPPLKIKFERGETWLDRKVQKFRQIETRLQYVVISLLDQTCARVSFMPFRTE